MLKPVCSKNLVLLREILFRGKKKGNKDWVVGSLICLSGASGCYYYILPSDTPQKAQESGERLRELIEISPLTVGQYIGIVDKYGNKIFEGDIVQYEDEELAEIVWDEQTARFEIKGDGVIYDFDNFYGRELEVIGNRWDNPELLKEENDDE